MSKSHPLLLIFTKLYVIFVKLHNDSVVVIIFPVYKQEFKVHIVHEIRSVSNR